MVAHSSVGPSESECDGAFAQYARAPARETYKVECDWSDAELASIPCAYSTAENLPPPGLGGGESACWSPGLRAGSDRPRFNLRNAAAPTSSPSQSTEKADAVRAVGADEVVDRNTDLATAVGHDGIDVVVDLVAGASWPRLLDVLRRGGRYATAGAIAGPLVELDVRTLYLKDLTLFGCTFQEDEVFENLVSYVERGEIRPLVARTFPPARDPPGAGSILAKAFTGKLVLIPPG